MSLDCYPLGKRRVITLHEQPLALDVVYNDNLLVILTNHCQTIAIYDLLESEENNINLIKKISLAKDVVVDQIVYCHTGDYLACVGHKDYSMKVYTIFNWRQKEKEPIVLELDQHEKEDKLSGIDCCQMSGNLAISCGDIVYIYKYMDEIDKNILNEQCLTDEDDPSIGCKAFHDKDIEGTHSRSQLLRHVITIQLSIYAFKICLMENYLSITASDHVQVLKLELLTLQLQPEACLDEEVLMSQQTNDRRTSSCSDRTNYNRTQSETTSTSTTLATTSSLLSETNSATTNFSSFNTNNNEQLNGLNIGNKKKNQRSHGDLGSETTVYTNESADGCITWNLNTKKLVKLPTLMHNTSTNLSSYHICHPLELLGPASESIACRVSALIYSEDYCQNQLEAVVMLCKQFDPEEEPVKSTHLQPVYLNNLDDKKRLSKATIQDRSNKFNINHDPGKGGGGGGGKLLKSRKYELLVSVTCFVTTFTNCFVYSLHGKRVSRSQIITLPDLCVDLIPDLLNVYLLTTLGLQICSSGICDSTFRYEWSSSSDLNLNFIAVEKTRILASSSFIILVSCSVNGQCEIEYFEKPDLSTLYEQVIHIVDRCDSISVRCNMLTYLHAMAQLNLLTDIDLKSSSSGSLIRRKVEEKEDQSLMIESNSKKMDTLPILKSVTAMLCKQLLQKKQANVITNNLIDKAIIHLLDISKCDISIVDLSNHAE